MQPLVSIIINCYNGEKTLDACLQSVLAQSYNRWEVIFFDSASEDKSLAIARAYGDFHSDTSDSRFICLAHPTRPILGEARRLALEHAQGKYITFLDVDDVWHAEKLALQVQYMQAHPHVHVLCTDTGFFTDFPHKGAQGQHILRHSIFSKSRPARGLVFEELITRQWMILSSVMLRRSAVQALQSFWGTEYGFDPQLQLAADADLLYRLAHEGACDFLPQVLTQRRMHTNNITYTQGQAWAQEIQHILDKFCRRWPDFSTRYPVASKALQKRIVFQKALSAWRTGQGSEARNILRKEKYFSPKFCLLYLLSFLSARYFPLFSRWYWRLPACLTK